MLHDSGQRREFESGAVRDVCEGKGRCDLLPLAVLAEALMLDDSTARLLGALDGYLRTGQRSYLQRTLRDFARDQYGSYAGAMLELAKQFEDGAKKCGDRNWQKGIPVHCYLDSAIRHLLKLKRGDDDEPHDRAFLWNVACALWTIRHKPELVDIEFEGDAACK